MEITSRFDTYGKSVANYINEGDRIGVVLSVEDFEMIDGVWCLDGAPADQWIEDMASEETRTPIE